MKYKNFILSLATLLTLVSCNIYTSNSSSTENKDSSLQNSESSNSDISLVENTSNSSTEDSSSLASESSTNSSVSSSLQSSSSDTSTPNYVPENYSLIWNDEFDGDSLDETKWTYEIGTGNWGWGNNEQQYYRRENLTVKDGMMTITAKKENFASMKYTSSRIKTQGKFSFTYGYVEARISCPSMSGIWPAFWTLGDKLSTLGWPYCGELDIMEEINSENKVYSTMHWNNAPYNQYAPVQYGKNITLDDRTNFHTYAMKWTQDKVWTYCDGRVVLDGGLINDDFKKLAFNNSHFLILNLAVGGNWPGFNIADNFPQQMVVDYVRVYQESK